jgi:hypothetical protein
LAAAALTRVYSIPLVFVPHAPAVSNPARIKAALAIFYGKRSEAEFLAAGSTFSRTLHYGWMEKSAPRVAGHGGAICISLSKDVSLPFLKESLDMISSNMGVPVIVRMHPNSFVSARKVSNILPPGVELSTENSLAHDFDRISLHIAGNSTIHLESLGRGIPTYYLVGLDGTGAFPIRAIQEHLIPRVSLEDLKNLNARILHCPTIHDVIETEKDMALFGRELQSAFYQAIN